MGLRSANPAITTRLDQRSRKLCAFQLKNAAGGTAVRSTRLPSTRQKTGPRAPAGNVSRALALFSLSVPETNEDIMKRQRLRAGISDAITLIDRNQAALERYGVQYRATHDEAPRTLS